MESFLARRADRKVWLIGLTLLALAPALGGLIGRLQKWRTSPWGGDYQAVACAALRSAEGLTRYPVEPDCEGMQAAQYIYTPYTADLFAWIIGLIGEDALRIVYAALTAAALAFMAWLAVISKRVPGRFIERIGFMGFWTGSIFLWWNIAILLYAAIMAASLLAVSAPWAFVAVVALAAVVKPVFLTSLAVVLYLPISIMRRAVLFLTGAALGLAPTVSFMRQDHPETANWRALLDHAAFEQTTGQGFLGMAELAGLHGMGPAAIAAYLVFAATIVLSGFAVAERLALKAQDRVWLGLLVAVLVNPRLIAHDFFMLAPGAMALLYAVLARADAIGRRETQAVQWLIFGGCYLTAVMNVAELGDYAMMTGVAALAAALVLIGAPRAPDAIRNAPWLFRPAG